jgi:phospholipid/cholesterol/gamma-HCH transport system substrate-binding protein
VRQLGPFLEDARALVADAEPTVRDLRITIDRSGKDNDLIDLLDSFPALADLAVVTRDRTASPGGRAVDVGETRGSLVESTEAFKNAAPVIAFGRPYTPDFFGWFDDFSTTGAGFDALGAMARGHVVFVENLGGTSAGHFDRCPGSAEPVLPDGSNVLTEEEQEALRCTEADRASD